MATSSEHNDDDNNHHPSVIVPVNPFVFFAGLSPPLMPVVPSSCPSVAHHQITESSSSTASASASPSSLPPPPHLNHHQKHSLPQQQRFAQQQFVQQQLVEPAPQGQQASSSVSRVSALEAASRSAAAADPLPGYAAVRDDIELDIYSLFFSPPTAAAAAAGSGAAQAEVQQAQQQAQPQQVQPQPQPQLLQEQHQQQQREQQYPPSPIASSTAADEPPTNGAVIMPERTHAAMASLTSFPTVPLVMPSDAVPPAAAAAPAPAGTMPMPAPPAMPSVVSPELPPPSSLAMALTVARNQREAHERRRGSARGAAAVVQGAVSQRSARQQLQQDQRAPSAPPQRQLAQVAPASAQQKHLQKLGFQALQIHLQQQQEQRASRGQRPAAPSPSPQPQPQPQLQPPQQLQLQQPSSPADKDSAVEAAMEAQRIAAAMSRRNFAPKKKRRKIESATTATTSAMGGPPKKRGYSPYVSSSSSSVSVVGGTAASSGNSSSSSAESPHSYVLSLLSSRGYPTSIHKSSECGYKSSPSSGPPAPLQLASYGTSVLRAVQSDDADGTLGGLLGSGLSPNPCNRFSESVLDMSAKRGLAKAFRVQLDAGADVQTADDFGRTPLHHAAWGSGSSGSSSSDAEEARFDIVTRILLQDPDMVRVADERGQCPLEYVRGSEERGRWIDFLKENADRFWPVRANSAAADGAQEMKEVPRPKRRPAGARIPDPPNALPAEVAKLVASGRVKPEEAGDVHPDSLPPEREPPQQAGAFKFPSMLASYQKTSG